MKPIESRHNSKGPEQLSVFILIHDVFTVLVLWFDSKMYLGVLDRNLTKVGTNRTPVVCVLQGGGHIWGVQ